MNVRLALESGGASDSVMVHLLSVSKGVWREGKTLTFAFPLNQSRWRKSPPLRGNLFDVWMSECIGPLLKHIHGFTALDRLWVFYWDPAGKVGPFFSHFFPSMYAAGQSSSPAVRVELSPRWRAGWCTFLPIFQNGHRAPSKSNPLLATRMEFAHLFAWQKTQIPPHQTMQHQINRI